MAVSAAAFEGKVTQSIRGKDKAMFFTYAMKDGLLRMEPQTPEAHGTAMIFNYEKKEMIIMMPEKKMYMTMSLQGAIDSAAQATGHNSSPNITKTGKTVTILGYPCEQYQSKGEKGETIEIWVTDKLGMFMGLGSGGGPMGGRRGGGGEQAWEQLVKGKEGFFPLRVIIHDASGKESFALETKSVEPGTLPASLFTPPDDYKTLSIPGMGGMMHP